MIAAQKDQWLETLRVVRSMPPLKQLRWIDLEAGKLVGVPKDAPGLDTRGAMWAMGLGVKIVLAGGAASLLFMMVVMIASFNNPIFNGLAAVGWGLSVFMIAQAVSNDLSLTMPLAIELGTLPLVALIGGVFGLGFARTFNAASPIFSLVIGVWLAMSVFEFLSKCILKALTTTDEPPRKMPKTLMGQIRYLKLMTPQERRTENILLVWLGACIVCSAFSAALVIALVASSFVGATPPLSAYIFFVVVAVASAFGFILAIPRVDIHKKRVIDRVKASGTFNYIQDPITKYWSKME